MEPTQMNPSLMNASSPWLVFIARLQSDDPPRLPEEQPFGTSRAFLTNAFLKQGMRPPPPTAVAADEQQQSAAAVAADEQQQSEPWHRLRNEHGGLTVQSRDCFRFSLSLLSLIAWRDQQLMTQIDDSSSSVIVRPQSRRTRGINDRSRGAEGRHK